MWVAVETTGPTPSPRTCHYSGTTAVVYSGGYKDINPVDDTKIYFFNAGELDLHTVMCGVRMACNMYASARGFVLQFYCQSNY